MQILTEDKVTNEELIIIFVIYRIDEFILNEKKMKLTFRWLIVDKNN